MRLVQEDLIERVVQEPYLELLLIATVVTGDVRPVEGGVFPVV